jgi:hypothetical protein
MEMQSFVTLSAAIRLAGRGSLRRDPGEIRILGVPSAGFLSLAVVNEKYVKFAAIGPGGAGVTLAPGGFAAGALAAHQGASSRSARDPDRGRPRRFGASPFLAFHAAMQHMSAGTKRRG